MNFSFLRPAGFACLLTLFTFAFPVPGSAQSTRPNGNEAAMFPFVLPPFDDSQTVTDVSWMNHAPAGKHGFIKSQGEHFVTGNGDPIRFWGVNLNFQGVFPPKDQAPKIAARLAKFGFNSVRIHHFDGNAAPNGIWKPLVLGGTRLKMPREFDPEQLDRFDFFMAELIKRGIYVNINLHVGRKVQIEEGFPRAGALPDKDKGVNYFDEKLIGAHKEFARQILTHVNPYTERKYSDEPGVCAVEITNENSILGMWLDGSFSKFPEFYAQELRGRWHNWLKAKYSDDAALRAAWTELDDPIHGGDVLAQPYPPGIVNPNAPDSRMSIGMHSMRRFKFKSDSGAQADVDIDPLGGPTFNGFVRPGLSVFMRSLGNEKWGFQLNRDGLNLQNDQPYTLSFWARSDRPRRISVNLWADKQPFEFLGFSGFADLNTEWQQYSFVFRPTQSEPNHARMNFNFGNATGTVQLAEISVQAGGRLAAPSHWTLGSVPLIELRTTQVWNARADFAQFLGGIESEFYRDMRGFLRDELGVKCPIWNTQAQFGGWGGLWREREGDAIDVHAYWKHPIFEGGEWTSGKWRVENLSMTTAPGVDPLSGFSYFRLKGKPFVMSEWNSGQPNDFGQESLLMIAAYAAWQDWAGIYLFDYHSSGGYDRDFFKGYFSIDTHPAKMATAPAAALIFRRPQTARPQDREIGRQGDVSTPASLSPGLPVSPIPSQPATLPQIGDALTATRETILTMPHDWIWHEVARSSGEPTPALVLPTWREAGAARSAALMGKVYAQFGEAAFATTNRSDREPKNLWVSDTRQVKWSKQPSVFIFNGEQSKSAIGFLGGYQLTLGEWKITTPAGGNNFETLALSSLDGQPVIHSKRLLLTATGKSENIAMGWNAERNSVGNNWGRGPSMVEGIDAHIQLLSSSSKVKVYALGPTGVRASAVPSTLSRGRVNFTISPRYRTTWYEIAFDE